MEDTDEGKKSKAEFDVYSGEEPEIKGADDADKDDSKKVLVRILDKEKSLKPGLLEQEVVTTFPIEFGIDLPNEHLPHPLAW